MNAWPTRSRNSATCALTQIIKRDEPEHDSEQDELADPVVLEEPAEVEARQGRQRVDAREHALRQRPGEERRRAQAMSTIASTALELTSVV